MAWSIVPAPVPDSLESADAWGMHGTAALSSAAEQERWGHDDLAYSPADCLTYLRNQEYATRLQLLAVQDPAVRDSAMLDSAVSGATRAPVLGAAWLTMPKRGNERLAYLEVTVHPDHRRAGLGGALVDRCEQIAADHGRRTLIAHSEHAGEPAADDARALEPPTGSGRIDGASAAAVLARGRGYALEQAERYSVLSLPVDPDLLQRLHSDAAERAGRDYRLVSWVDRTPEEWLEQMAGLYTRMSTDVPVAGLEIEEDPWDDERVRRAEQDVAASGHGHVVVATEHVPTGTLTAFTSVEYPLERSAVVLQNDTLVLRDHRGHRLGMLVKTEMLRRLAEIRPRAARVHTWNAEENAFMLGINVALGFRPAGVVGLWQKKLPGAPGPEEEPKAVTAEP